MSETINDTKARLEAFISENYPDVDIAPGSVISELLIKLSASVQNELHNEIAELNDVSSIQLALSSETDTYSPVIDKIASNYLVSRNLGKKSTGKLKVYVARRRNYQIRSNLVFFQPNLNLSYVTTAEYNVSPTPEADDVPLYETNGQFFFIIPVEAVEAGPQYQVSNRTKFSLGPEVTLTDFVVAEAYGNFTSGLSQETDKELIARIQNGLSNKGLLSPKSILANLQEQNLNVQDISIIGSRDIEMVRAKQNAFKISTLGMADVYVRTSRGPETTTFEAIATKTEQGTWSIKLDANNAAGFYRVVSIFPQDSNLVGSLEILSETYGYSTNEFAHSNSVYDVQGARFTRYQTCEVIFNYGESPALSVGDTIPVEVTVSYQPNISEIQDIFVADLTRILCADYLVKAAVPCFVSVNLRLFKANPSETLPVDKLKQDIFNYINTIPFGEDLHASKIVDICHNYNIKRVDLPISMTGTILGTNGETLTITSSDTLVIPTDLAKGISKNTTQFFIDYYRPDGDGSNLIDNIGIEVL